MNAKAGTTPKAGAKPALPVTRGDDLAERLADDITASVFAPGSRLDEVRLAARYGTSRTPVREALRQLEALGLVERRPYRGAVVSAPSPQHLAEMFAAAAEIEASCARLAAVAMTTGERAALRKAHDGMRELARGADLTAFADASAAFQERLYAGAHNATIVGFARDLRRRLKPFRRDHQLDGRLERLLAEQEDIVAAIEHKRPDDAARLMRRQIDAAAAEPDGKGATARSS